jgi:hypothetical protein
MNSLAFSVNGDSRGRCTKIAEPERSEYPQKQPGNLAKLAGNARREHDDPETIRPRPARVRKACYLEDDDR